MTTIKELSDEPKYSIKTVSAQTGILPVTLRAWERRHELLSPHRSGNRYRLYSERDVAILRWIKNRTDAGISISQAVAELRSMARSGVSPDAIQGPVEPKVKQITAPLEEYALRLAQALMKHDEVAAEQVLDDLQDAIPLRDYCTRVLVPALVEIGEAWYNGKIRVATEHWASAFLRGRLLTMYQSLPLRRTAPYILVGCAPTEQHEMGSLMFAPLLRAEGYRVEYLGPDLPIDDLVEYTGYERPAMVILAATSDEAGKSARSLAGKLAKLKPAPLFGYGGAAYNRNPTLRSQMGGTYLGPTLDEALDAVHGLLNPGFAGR